MIAHISGRVLSYCGQEVIVDVGGIGYEILVPESLCKNLSTGEDVSLHIRMLVREGLPTLFGFESGTQRRYFDRVLKIQGVGPQIALALISALGIDGLDAAVNSGSSETLRGVHGVGAKLASRLVLELRGFIEELAVALPGEPQGLSAVKQDVVGALRSLGFTQTEIGSVLGVIPEGLSSSQAVRVALKELGR